MPKKAEPQPQPPLELFVRDLRNDVLRFERYWVKMNKQEPAAFPMFMGSGDWFEQFLSFVTTEEPGS